MVTAATVKEVRGGQAVAVLAFVNAAIMLLRFSEQCILARALGAGQRFDAYFIGQIVVLLGGQLTVAVTSAAVPIVVDAGESGDAAMRRLLLAMAGVLGVASVLIAVLSGPIIHLLGGRLNPESRLLARAILLWLLPATDGCIIAALLRAYWHAHRRFVIPGIGQLFMPLCTCAGAALLALGVWDLTYAAAVANVGVVVLLFVLSRPLMRSLPQVSSAGHYVERLKAFSKRFWTSLIPVGIALALMPAMIVVARSFAAHLVAGSVTAISLAASLGSIPAQFAAVSVGVVLLSQTALLKASGRIGDGARMIERALCNTAFVVTPAAVVLTLFSKQIVEVVFQRGAFDKAAVGLTASALGVYSFGVPFQAAVQVLTFALLAIAASRRVAIMAGVTLGTNVLLSRLLLPWGVAGLAGAFSLASCLDCVVLAWLLAKALPDLHVRSLLLRQGRILAFSVVAGEIGSVVARYLEPSHASLKLLVALVICGLVYLGINLLVSGPELKEIIGTARSQVSRLGRVEVLSAVE